MKKYYCFLFIFTSFLNSCQNKNTYLSGKQSYFYENFKEFKKHKLSSDLREISGLSFSDKTIFTHNDEEGKIFTLNPESGNIVDEFKFGKKGDYEGIVVKNKIAYVIKSNGKGIIYNLKTKEKAPFITPLNEKNNAEGICFNLFDKNELLIACKGKTIEKTKYEKAIYRYNFVKNKFHKTPFIRIIIKELQQFTKENKYSKKEKGQIKKFAPSGIAIDPITKYSYILSAKGSSLAIFDGEELKDIVFLNTDNLPQPEGICFDSKGNLHIASEGKSKKATLVTFLRKT